jgi:hypothetical protein
MLFSKNIEQKMLSENVDTPIKVDLASLYSGKGHEISPFFHGNEIAILN